jgi:hypothetical protein
MKVLGIDFTCSPNRRKPITCLSCVLSGGVLSASAPDLQELHDWDAFESALAAPGPWIAGIDLPFGQSRTFIQNIGWPLTWAGYVQHVSALDRAAFRAALNAYRACRRQGDKEQRFSEDDIGHQATISGPGSDFINLNPDAPDQPARSFAQTQRSGPFKEGQWTSLPQHKTIRSLEPFAGVIRDTIHNLRDADNAAPVQIFRGQLVSLASRSVHRQ